MDQKAVMTMDAAKIQAALNQQSFRIIDNDLFARSAVLVPLIRNPDNEWSVLFQVRASHLKRQPGEICFPGGTLEGPGENPLQAAHRETGEELGLTSEQISIWGELGLIISPFNLLLFSFVGEIPEVNALKPSPDEVDSVFALPLTRLLALQPKTHHIYIQAQPAADFPFDKIPGGQSYPWRTGVLPEVFYEIDGHIIWGLTARILQQFLDLVRKL
ncbi:MAG: NUDIX hydrolase [bacterium]|jgi:coenzyme A diphosphatase NUDT7